MIPRNSIVNSAMTVGAVAALAVACAAFSKPAQAQAISAPPTLAPGQFVIGVNPGDPCSTENILRMHQKALDQALEAEHNTMLFNMERANIEGTALHTAQSQWREGDGVFDGNSLSSETVTTAMLYGDQDMYIDTSALNGLQPGDRAAINQYLVSQGLTMDPNVVQVGTLPRPMRLPPRDEDACWGRAADMIAHALSRMSKGIRGIFKILEGDFSIDWGTFNLGELVCSVGRRIDRTAAYGIRTVGKLPEYWIRNVHRDVRWKRRSYENYGRWHVRRTQQAPDRYTRGAIREWTSDLPIAPPWGYPDNSWPSEWRRRGG